MWAFLGQESNVLVQAPKRHWQDTLRFGEIYKNEPANC